MEKRNTNRTEIINPAITLGDYEKKVKAECVNVAEYHEQTGEVSVKL